MKKYEKCEIMIISLEKENIIRVSIEYDGYSENELPLLEIED